MKTALALQFQRHSAFHIAPRGTRAVFGWLNCFTLPLAVTEYPPTMSEPLRLSIDLPSAPIKRSHQKQATLRLLASPAEETVISSLVPERAKGGNVAETKTAAKFCTRIDEPERSLHSEKRCRQRLYREGCLLAVTGTLQALQTMPYPTSWLSRIPLGSRRCP